METMRVDPLGGDRFAISVRGHRIVVDQPVDQGGSDAGPTPTELFVAGLTSCVAYYAARYLRRHGVRADRLQVDADWWLAEDRPTRVGGVDIVLTPPPELPPERVPGLLAVARRCTVHNSLTRSPDVHIDVPGAVERASAG